MGANYMQGTGLRAKMGNDVFVFRFLDRHILYFDRCARRLEFFQDELCSQFQIPGPFKTSGIQVDR